MFSLPFIDRLLGRVFQHRKFDDVVDRLNYTYTSAILIFFAIMVSAKQYVGSPIQCFMPMEFKHGWEQYAEDLCFIKNTFFVPLHKEIPGTAEEREQAEIGYYQWTPIVLTLQALAFYLPNWVWINLYKQSGLDLSTIVGESTKIRAMPAAGNRHNSVKELATFISDNLHMSFTYGRNGINRKVGTYTSILYIFVKFFYLSNIFTQFFIMNRFLGSNYTFWGIQTLADLWSGHEWMDSGVFPRVTLCDFTVRKLANLHRYTVQCVLVINLFNEKIYLFLWFWFLFVAISTLVNTVNMIFRLCFFGCRQSFVRKLIISDQIGDDQTDEYKIRRFLSSFVQNGLQTDGVLMLYFIEGHAGGIVAKEVASALYGVYLEKAYNAQSTNTTSPGIENVEEGPHEALFEKHPPGSLMVPDYPVKHA